MWLLAVGVVLAVMGATGVVLAPMMIKIRREEGLLDDASDQISDEDRVLVTRVMGAVFLTVGVLLAGYQLSG